METGRQMIDRKAGSYVEIDRDTGRWNISGRIQETRYSDCLWGRTVENKVGGRLFTIYHCMLFKFFYAYALLFL